MAGEQLRQMAAAARAFPRDFVEEAADTIEEAVEERLERDTGGDRSLSRAPSDLSVKVKVAGSRTATVKIEAEGGERGQWKWLEEGTQPHGFHPGTTGKGTWTEASRRPVAALTREASERFNALMSGGG